MIRSLSYIFRKEDLSRGDFRDYYETRHVALAQKILPEFSHYVRNHVIESSDESHCPDCISEFSYDDESELLETMAILGDERGQVLLHDELKFMERARNAVFPVVWSDDNEDAIFLQKSFEKVIVALRGDDVDIRQLCQKLRQFNSAICRDKICSELGANPEGQLHWLMLWSEQTLNLSQLQIQLREQGAAMVWCARVDERRGYP